MKHISMSANASTVALALRTVQSTIKGTKSKKEILKSVSFCDETLTSGITYKYKCRDYTKKLKFLSNTMQGIISGIEDGTLKRKDLLELGQAINDQADDLIFLSDEYEAKQLERGEAPITVQTTADLIMAQLSDAIAEQSGSSSKKATSTAFQEALVKAVNTSPIVVKTISTSTVEIPDVVRSEIENLHELRSLIPQTIKAGFAMIRLPVVPIFVPIAGASGSRIEGAGSIIQKQPNPNHLLKAAGLKSLRVEEYTIMLDQMCILVDKTELPSVALGKGRKKLKAGVDKYSSITKTSIENRVTPLSYVQEVLDIINETTNKDLSLVDLKPTTSPRNADILIFWVMPTAMLNYIKGKRFPLIKEWNLPF